MGYRSEWVLKVNGTRQQVDAFEAYLQCLAQQTSGEVYDAPSCATTIMKALDGEREQPDGAVLMVWHDDSTKCYGAWDQVVRDLLSFARDELKMLAAYGRIGEDLNDTEFDNDSGFYVEYECRLFGLEAS